MHISRFSRESIISQQRGRKNTPDYLALTIYLKIAMAIDAKNRGDEEALKKINYPDINAGIDGIRWITKCVESADKGGVWVPFND